MEIKEYIEKNKEHILMHTLIFQNVVDLNLPQFLIC